MTPVSRRSFLRTAALAGAALSAGTLALPRSTQRVVVIGGGPAGVSAAMTLKEAAPDMSVALIERDPTRLAPGASSAFARPSLATDLTTLAAAGVELILDDVAEIDWQAGRLALFSGRQSEFDRLVMAAGVSPIDEGIEGYDARARHLWPAAWGSLREARRLEAQLAALSETGHVVLRLPAQSDYAPMLLAGRALALANHLAAYRPSARLTVIDGSKDSQSWGAFSANATPAASKLTGWHRASVTAVDPDAGILMTDAGQVRADLVNFLPVLGAGHIARSTGLTDASGWCPCDTAQRSTLQDTAIIVGDAQTTDNRGVAMAAETGRLGAATLLF